MSRNGATVKGYLLKKFDGKGKLLAKRIIYDGAWEQVKQRLKYEFTEGVELLTLTCQKGDGWETKRFIRAKPKE